MTTQSKGHHEIKAYSRPATWAEVASAYKSFDGVFAARIGGQERLVPMSGEIAPTPQSFAWAAANLSHTPAIDVQRNRLLVFVIPHGERARAELDELQERFGRLDFAASVQLNGTESLLAYFRLSQHVHGRTVSAIRDHVTEGRGASRALPAKCIGVQVEGLAFVPAEMDIPSMPAEWIGFLERLGEERTAQAMRDQAALYEPQAPPEHARRLRYTVRPFHNGQYLELLAGQIVEDESTLAAIAQADPNALIGLDEQPSPPSLKPDQARFLQAFAATVRAGIGYLSKRKDDVVDAVDAGWVAHVRSAGAQLEFGGEVIAAKPSRKVTQ